MSSLRLKHVTRMRAGGTPPVDDPSMWDENNGLPWVAIGDMTRNPIVETTDRRVSVAGIAENSLPIGDVGTVLFAMYASVGALGRLNTRASWNQAILGMTPLAGRADSRFLAYWLTHLTPTLGALFRSNTQNNLNAEQVGNLPFVATPVEEQCGIANFLDSEIARIDRLIEMRVRQMLLSGERLKSLTADCISGCFSGEVSRAHPVLGPVAATWPVIPLKRVVRRIGVGVVVNPSSYFVDDGVPFVHGGNVREGRFDLDGVKQISEPDSRLLRRSRLEAGDVVVVRAGYPGRAAVVPESLAGANCASVLLIKPGRVVIPKWLEVFFNSPQGRSQVSVAQYGAAQEQINVGDVVDFLLPVPPLPEQARLMSLLAQEEDRHQRLRALLEKQSRGLRERKQALITAAVTGQLDVTTARGVA